MKPDWDKLRIEYETTNISYRKLAEKYSIPFPTIRDRAKREKWASQRNATRNKIIAETSQKIVTKRADAIANEIDPAIEATDLIFKVVLEALKDENQFKRHLVQRKEKTFNTSGKTKDSPAITESSESWWVEEKIFEVVDTKRLLALAQSLKASTELKRLINGVLSQSEIERLLLDREKLDIEKQKAKDIGKDEVFEIIDPFADNAGNNNEE